MTTPRMNYKGTITDANTVPHPDATLAQVLTNMTGQTVTTDAPPSEPAVVTLTELAESIEVDDLDAESDTSILDVV